ncbi:MAG: hypothetical protein WC869_08245 [Phycisphaerae bacterium]|jgi:hypothetical protein
MHSVNVVILFGVLVSLDHPRFVIRTTHPEKRDNDWREVSIEHTVHIPKDWPSQVMTIGEAILVEGKLVDGIVHATRVTLDTTLQRRPSA